MGFAIDTRDIARVYNFEAAQRLFTNAAKPRGSKWEPHQRPLRDTRSTHLRIEQHEGGRRYDVFLYQTAMAQYYAPDKHGQRRIVYAPHSSTVSSRTFRWHVLDKAWINNQRTVLGEEVALLIGGRRTTDITLDKHGHLITSESTQPRMYMRISSEKDTTERAAIRARVQAKMEDIFIVAALRLDAFKENADVDSKWCAAFAGSHWNTRLSREARRAIKVIADDPAAATEAHYKAFLDDAAQRTVNIMASCTAARLQDEWAEQYGQRRTFATYADAALDTITQEKFIDALRKQVLRVVGEVPNTGRKDLPLWMAYDEFPRRSKLLQWA